MFFHATIRVLVPDLPGKPGTKPKPTAETPKIHYNSPQKPKIGFIHSEMV
jgi:hypothetical protein